MRNVVWRTLFCRRVARIVKDKTSKPYSRCLTLPFVCPKDCASLLLLKLECINERALELCEVYREVRDYAFGLARARLFFLL